MCYNYSKGDIHLTFYDHSKGDIHIAFYNHSKGDIPKTSNDYS